MGCVAASNLQFLFNIGSYTSLIFFIADGKPGVVGVGAFYIFIRTICGDIIQNAQKKIRKIYFCVGYQALFFNPFRPNEKFFIYWY